MTEITRKQESTLVFQVHVGGGLYYKKAKTEYLIPDGRINLTYYNSISANGSIKMPKVFCCDKTC